MADVHAIYGPPREADYGSVSFEGRPGFVTFHCPPSAERRAQEMQAEDDAKYRADSPYQPASSDCPWMGKLGEMVFDRYMTILGIEHTWLRENPLHQPDFIVPLGTVDCKTSKRQVPPKPEYTCGVSTRQLYRTVDWYFFMTYEVPARRMWLLGAIRKENFLCLGKPYAAGDAIHPGYVVRAGNEITNLPMAELATPVLWAQDNRLAQE